MYFSLRFVLWLKWSDSRLIYENLDENHWKNKVSNDMAAKLWTPWIVFKNNIDGKILAFDPSSPSLFLKRLSSRKNLETPLSRFHEAQLYSSNETAIYWRSEHLLKFKCRFDLFYLPFDTQTCFVEVSLTLRNTLEYLHCLKSFTES